MGAKPIVIACVLSACSPASEPEAPVVDVVLSAPSESAPQASAFAASTLKVSPAPVPRDAALEDPRRVLQPPPIFPAPFATGSSLPPQTALPLAPANAGPLTAVFTAFSQSQVVGSTPEGTLVGGAFKQGDTLHLAITLQPNRCYSFVAVSSGISELDLALMLSAVPGMPFPPLPLAVDMTNGPMAVIGAGNNCFKNPTPMPMPATLVVRATIGTGAAIARGFSR